MLLTYLYFWFVELISHLYVKTKHNLILKILPLRTWKLKMKMKNKKES